MRQISEGAVLARLVLLMILLALSGVTPRPHRVSQALQQAGREMRASGASQAAARAAQALAQAAEHLPWREDLWVPAARLALQAGDLTSAVQYFERAAAQGTLTPEDQMKLGDAYAQQGEALQAIRVWEAMLDAQGPDPELLSRLLEAHRKLGDIPAAIEDLQALTALQPTDAALRYQLGLLLATQQPGAALAHLTQAAELDPSLEEKTQAVIGSIRTGSLSEEPAQALFEAGRALASIGEWDLAGEAFRQVTLLRPDFADAWAFWGEARQHLQEGFFGQPFPSQLDKALSLEPESLSANTLAALYWRRQGRFDKALEHIRLAVAAHPQNPALQVEMGETLALGGDLEAALQAHQRAIELAPNDPTYLRSLAGFCIRNEYQLRESGLPAARQAVILNPQDPESLDVLGQTLVLLGDLASAEREFQRAIQLEPEHAAAHLHLGLVYILQGERGRARQEWERVLSLAPDSAYAEQTERLLKNYFP